MKRFLAPVWMACVLALALVSASVAQTTSNAERERYNALTLRAEEAIKNDTLEEETFEAMRARIAEYRAEFDAARNANAVRIATLREQLSALGPAPEEGATPAEDLDITARRTELNAQLTALLAPVQTAESSFVEADALVRQIDQLLRSRQTNKLLSTSPSPLNPVHWPQAIEDVKAAISGAWMQGDQSNPPQVWEDVRGNLPIVFLSAFIGLVLIFRGRRWSTKIVGRLGQMGARGFGIWRFVISLLRIIFPFVGLTLVALAIGSAGVLGDRGNEVLILVPIIGGMMLGFRWVSDRVFSRDDDEALLLFSQEARKEARFFVSVITIMIVIDVILETLLEYVSPATATQSVIGLPICIIISFSLFRIGKILRSAHGLETNTVDADQEATRVTTFQRVVRSLGTGAVIVACIAPLLMAAGYFDASKALLQPYVMTMILLGLVMALQRFLADIYGAVTGQGIQARETLMPVIFGMALIVFAAPLLALIWGARLTDLTEVSATLGRGISLGDSRISPTDFLKFAVIFVIGYALTRLVQGLLRSNVLPKTKIDIGGQNAIVSGLGYVGIFLAALAAITGAGIDLSSLAIVAGALSVGIGFGLQNIVSNFVSGIILLIERPISQGDWIEVGGQMGYVRDISVRSTRIETFDRTDVIVPNADLVSGTVTNYTRGNTVGRVIVQVGVAYGTDTRRVDKILREIAEAQPMVLASPPPNVVFMNFGADALEFEIRMMLRDVNWMLSVKNDVNHAIAERFAVEGIEIPFAQRDLWIRNPEALTGPGPLKASKTPKGKAGS